MKTKVKNNEAIELKSQLTRALADYDNLRKRTEAEKSIWLKFAKQELLIKLLPILDTLEIAQKHLNDKGLEIAVNQFRDVLKEEGVIEIEAGVFDEGLHEAIDTASGGKDGTIAEIVSKGYKFNDGTVIRHAKVKVYKGENKNE